MSPVTPVIDFETLTLASGGHSSRAKGTCVMEAVAWLAGESHGDHPECACPIISAFARRWNDDLDDAGRQRLKRFIPRIAGSRSTRAVEQRRGWMAADWLVRVHTPAWLDLAGLKQQADALRALPEIESPTRLDAALEPLNVARTAAAAAWDAARAAAWAAAWDAARAAARDAARDAAWDVAWAAAWDAARAAAWAAARAAAAKKLEPTKVSLQQSAEELLDRMLSVTADEK